MKWSQLLCVGMFFFGIISRLHKLKKYILYVLTTVGGGRVSGCLVSFMCIVWFKKNVAVCLVMGAENIYVAVVGHSHIATSWQQEVRLFKKNELILLDLPA